MKVLSYEETKKLKLKFNVIFNWKPMKLLENRSNVLNIRCSHNDPGHQTLDDQKKKTFVKKLFIPLRNELQ